MSSQETESKKRPTQRYTRGSIYFVSESLFKRAEQVCEESGVKLSPLLQALVAGMTNEELIEAAKRGNARLAEIKVEEKDLMKSAIRKVDPAALEAFLKQQGAL